MISSQKQRKNKTHNGTLRTPVTFWKYGVANGLDVRESPVSVLCETFAEIYNPSQKDLTILKNSAVDVKRSVTLKIRDPLTDYQPDNKHFVEIQDERFAGRRWNIVDIRPDFYVRDFITILLAEV
ncbi:hypothetical protein Hs30E_12870 [Lactococcus hodotermopsidis]|uniref:Phage head-tail adapter protein n=1 Tax=Pseudolactococcus hodotermopsidis TaxID=2709157 RepID=A0A6A0BD32_9LACT|nr:phage head-tail adapter protein [Lactococcus hodotermopsidis]GFH42736.1 hypothetical protein Hs30E_12870 [Lactococcus hodotermopsidis]